MADDQASSSAVVQTTPATTTATIPLPALPTPVTTQPAPQSAGAPTAPLQPQPELDELLPAMSLSNLALLLLAVAIGAFAAVELLPAWLPGLTTSLLGSDPKAYWYLSRSSAFVAYGLVWLSMIFGLLITSRTARLWPGGPVALDLHQHSSLLGLAFALFHALILLGDGYIAYTPLQVLIPFAGDSYRPLWVGVGQIGLYAMAIVGLSFYMRPLIGRKIWRGIHFLSFLLFVMALIHGIFSGSDTAVPAIQGLYWFTGGSVLFLSVYRFLIAGSSSSAPARARRAA